jgi:hypothetical protein
MSRKSAGTARVGGDDAAKWWDDLLEEVASLAGDVTGADAADAAKPGWGSDRERLAGILSQSDPSLAAAAQMRASPTPEVSEAAAAGVPAPRAPEAVPPSPPAQAERGTPAIRAPRSNRPDPQALPVAPAAALQWQAPPFDAALSAPSGSQPAPAGAPSPPPPPIDVTTPSSPAPPPAFAPAAPGTIIELPERLPVPVAPWESGPGYIAPIQQTVATEMPTIGVPVAPGFVEAMTHRGYRPQGARLHARVRILWERLITRQQEERLVAGALILGMLAGALLILILIFVVRLF